MSPPEVPSKRGNCTTPAPSGVDVFDDELRSDAAAEFVDVQPVGDADRLAARGTLEVPLAIEGDRLHAARAPRCAERELQVALADEPARLDLERAVEDGLGKAMPP